MTCFLGGTYGVMISVGEAAGEYDAKEWKRNRPCTSLKETAAQRHHVWWFSTSQEFEKAREMNNIRFRRCLKKDKWFRFVCSSSAVIYAFIHCAQLSLIPPLQPAMLKIQNMFSRLCIYSREWCRLLCKYSMCSSSNSLSWMSLPTSDPPLTHSCFAAWCIQLLLRLDNLHFFASRRGWTKKKKKWGGW